MQPQAICFGKFVMQVAPPRALRLRVVGVTGVEPVTLRLSSACSNQLSYTPTIPACRAAARSTLAVYAQPPAFALLRRGSIAPASPRAKAGGAEEIRTPDL